MTRSSDGKHSDVSGHIMKDPIHYNALFESMNDGFVIIDADAILTFVNSRFSEMIKYTKKEILGKHVTAFVDEVGREILETTIGKRKRSISSHYELDWISKSGQRVSTLISGTPIIDKAEKFLGAFAIITDISSRRNIEESLIESENRYRSLFEDSPFALWEQDFSEAIKYLKTLLKTGIKDLHAYLHENPDVVDRCANLVKVLDVNRVSMEIQNVTDKEAILGSLSKVLKKDGTSGFIENLLALVDGKLSHQTGLQKLHMSGEERNYIFKISVPPGYEKSLEKVLFTIIDLTEVTRAQRALQESEELYRLHFENVSDVILSINEKGLILEISPSIVKLLGYNPSHFIGKQFSELVMIAPEHKTVLNTYLEKLLTDVSVQFEIFEFITRTGETRYGELTGTYVKRNGENSAIIVIRDITDRIRAETAEKTAQESASLYLDLMGHDISNQLQAILQGSALLEHQVTERSLQSQIDIIKESSERCAQIVTKARAMHGLTSEPLIPRSLSIVLGECVEKLANTSSGIVVDRSIDDVEIESDRFLEIFICELLENAVEHNKRAEKKVWVSLKRFDDGCYLSITDNGQGIPDKRKAELFDASRRFGGVGLHQVRHIVEKYGGTIETRDRIIGKPDQGVEFLVWFPIVINNFE